MKKITEHQQVRNALYNFGERKVKRELFQLAQLRKKADYDPFCDLTPADVDNAINHMESIFENLKFE